MGHVLALGKWSTTEAYQIQPLDLPEGSATILNHVDGFRNHLESLLESENQVEILESRIIISTFILGYLVFFRTL